MLAVILALLNLNWAPSSEFVSSSILAFCLKVPLDSLLVWASSESSGETARMRRLAWTFAARIGDKYQIHLTQSNFWYLHLSPVKRICVFEHSVMTNFNCACPAIQRGQGSGFLSEGSSWFTACMSEQRRFWRDCADAQARLNLRCSHRR